MSKTVLITGASKGIGATMAIRYAEKGYNVVMNYNNSVQSAILLQKSLKESGYSVIAYKANVKNRLEVDLMVKEALYRFGSIDILINNAGVAQQSLITDVSEQEWNDVVGVDLTGVFNRGFDTNFYFNTPFETSEDNQSKYIKKDIGQVVNYYNRVNVAELRVWDDLQIGDKIIIQGKTTGSITHTIDSMQVEGEDVQNVSKNSNVGVLLPEKVRKNDFVYKLVERSQDD